MSSEDSDELSLCAGLSEELLLVYAIILINKNIATVRSYYVLVQSFKLSLDLTVTVWGLVPKPCYVTPLLSYIEIKHFMQ